MDFRFFFPSKKGLDSGKGSVDFNLLKSRFISAKERAKKLDIVYRARGFYIKTPEYAERFCKVKLAALDVIYKRISNIFEGHILNQNVPGLINYRNTNGLLYDLIASYLGPYEEIIKWQKEVEYLRYDSSLSDMFSALYKAPAGFINAFEEFCLTLPDSANQCFKVVASGQNIKKAIPFLTLKSTHIDLISSNSKTPKKTDSTALPSEDKNGHESDCQILGVTTSSAVCRKAKLNCFLPVINLKDKQTRILINEKQLGWEYLLFALAIKKQIKKFQYASRNYHIGGYSHDSKITNISDAKCFCEERIEWLEEIIKGTDGVGKIRFKLLEDSASDEVAVSIISQSVEKYLNTYLELRLWLSDVSCLRYEPRFNYLFNLLSRLPQNILAAHERFYLSLYDKFYDHLQRLLIQQVKGEDSNGEASWRIEFESINKERINKELLRLSMIEADDGKNDASRDGGPVTVRYKNATTKTFSIPRPEPKKDKGLQLDFAKISVIEAESHRVTSMLNTIFDESAESSATPPPTLSAVETVDSAGCWGLDSEFSAFLRLLGSRPAWSRAELEELAADRSLMLDGVLEHINEAALDRFDQLFTEGDDPLEINQALIKEINS
jgi:hypothetical protein